MRGSLLLMDHGLDSKGQVPWGWRHKLQLLGCASPWGQPVEPGPGEWLCPPVGWGYPFTLSLTRSLPFTRAPHHSSEESTRQKPRAWISVSLQPPLTHAAAQSLSALQHTAVVFRRCALLCLLRTCVGHFAPCHFPYQ